MRLLRSFQYPTPIRLGLYRLAPVCLCRNDVPVYSVGCRVRGERDTARRLRARSDSDTVASDDPAPIYELLAERCRHVRVALEVMTGCE